MLTIGLIFIVLFNFNHHIIFNLISFLLRLFLFLFLSSLAFPVIGTTCSWNQFYFFFPSLKQNNHTFVNWIIQILPQKFKPISVSSLSNLNYNSFFFVLKLPSPLPAWGHPVQGNCCFGYVFSFIKSSQLLNLLSMDKVFWIKYKT
jgi:hypothetical protein